MSGQRERNDTIIRAALTPTVSTSLTSGLADAIHDALAITPQVRTSSRWSVGGQGFLGTARTVLAATLVIVALLLLIASIVVLSSRPRPRSLDVPMYRGGPERTGVMPGPGPNGDPVELWRVEANGTVAVQPAVFAGTVYVADDSGTVLALDVGTGHVRWQQDLQSPVNGSPAIAAERVIVGIDAGDVVALELATGREAWRFPTGGPVRASPAIVRDTLYVASDDGNVYALDAASGKERWRQSLGAPVTRGVAVSDGVVYAGATGGRFAALDAATGEPEWSTDILGPGEVGTPMVADGLVFVAGGLLEVGPSDQVRALDIRDGSVRWSFPGPDGEPVYAGAVADGAVYVSTNGGDVYRLDEKTGAIGPGWPFHTGGGTGYLSGLVDGVLYVPSGDRNLYAVDVRIGRERWGFPVEGAPYVPVIVDGRVFVGTDLGKIYAIGGSVPAATGNP